MFLYIVIFSGLMAAIRGGGYFSVLLNPSSIAFKGANPLESSYVGDVLLAALGNAVMGSITWPDMTIRDPFSLAQTSLIVIQVRGIYQLPTPPGTRNYELIGLDAEDSLNYLVSQLPNGTVYDINFANHKEGRAVFLSCFGTIDADIVQPIEILQPNQYWSHRHFLEELGLINLASENLDLVLKPSHALIFRLSLDRIAKVSQYEPISEAKVLVTATVQNLLKAAKERNGSVLMVQITNKHQSPLLSKSRAKAKSPINPFDKSSSEMQSPVINNLVLWFSLAFAISITAICYAIATIDPGRHSVIYQVSTLREFTKKRH